jgi:hypothetical protein
MARLAEPTALAYEFTRGERLRKFDKSFSFLITHFQPRLIYDE